jgi:hypothetical protein
MLEQIALFAGLAMLIANAIIGFGLMTYFLISEIINNA